MKINLWYNLPITYDTEVLNSCNEKGIDMFVSNWYKMAAYRSTSHNLKLFKSISVTFVMVLWMCATNTMRTIIILVQRWI